MLGYLQMDRETINQELQKHDEYTKELLRGTEGIESYLKSYRILGRAMLEFKLTFLMVIFGNVLEKILDKILHWLKNEKD